MTARASRPLTERQKSVIERIDRRVPIKVIAQELDISEARINQHIRALKDIFGAASLNELVELYRQSKLAEHADQAAETGSRRGVNADYEFKFNEAWMLDPAAFLEHAQPFEPAYSGLAKRRASPLLAEIGDFGLWQRFSAISCVSLGLLVGAYLMVSAGRLVDEAVFSSASAPVSGEAQLVS